MACGRGQVSFLSYRNLIEPPASIEHTVLSPRSLAINQWSKWVHFWILYSVPLVYFFIFVPVSQSAIVHSGLLWSGGGSAPLFFRITLAAVGCLHFNINFRISLVISSHRKSLLGFSVGLLSNLWVNLRRQISNFQIHVRNFSAHEYVYVSIHLNLL